jgi:hypothetical protein
MIDIMELTARADIIEDIHSRYPLSFDREQHIIKLLDGWK